MIDPNYFWTNIALLAVGTLAIRSSIILISSRIKFSAQVKEAFTFVPAAILPALAVPMAFSHQGQVTWLLGKERFVILLLATVVAYRTGKMTMTLIFGLVSLYLLNASV